jgi:hypothetical protein
MVSYAIDDLKGFRVVVEIGLANKWYVKKTSAIAL